MTADSYLTFQRNFKGQDSLLFILHEEGINWLITKLLLHKPFKIDFDTPIAAINYDVFEFDITSEFDISCNIESPAIFYCRMSPDAANANAKYLDSLKAAKNPRHQYLEGLSARGNALQLIASVDEYGVNDFL